VPSPATTDPGKPRRAERLHVLITAISLGEPDGSTMYTRDLALELLRCGHRPVVYTPLPGRVAAELEAAGVEVVDRLDRLALVPDVIHGNHTVETTEAVLRFEGTPAVFVCHGLGGWMAEPPKLAAIAYWVAVGTVTAGRLERSGLPPGRCRIIPNGVDTERFRPSSRARPARPERALVFSNNAAPGGYVDLVERACAERGIDLDVVGVGVGRPLESPDQTLGDYDLVFARGRCAREAISCGCAVVLVDIEGQGEMITTRHLATYDLAAFGAAVLTAPHDELELGHEIDRYDLDEVARTCEALRATCSATRMVERLVELYQEAVVAAPTETDATADLAWLLDELPRLSRIGFERDQIALARHLLNQHALSLEARVLHAEPALASAEAALASTQKELAVAESALDALRATRSFRARAWVLDSRWTGPLARRITRTGVGRLSAPRSTSTAGGGR
jgi:hypothetical protein